MAFLGDFCILFSMDKIIFPPFIQHYGFSDKPLDSVILFKQQFPAEVVVAGLTHGKTGVAFFIFTFGIS